MSWYTVPVLPRRDTGDTSDRYIGTKPAFKPEFIPATDYEKK